MTPETKDKVIRDAVEYGFLIETCLGCGLPRTERGAKLTGLRMCHDCPCGDGLSWNHRIIEFILNQKAVG